MSADCARAGRSGRLDDVSPNGAGNAVQHAEPDQYVERGPAHFTFRIEAGHEGAPLVVGTTMYMVTSFPNRLIAFDLARGGDVRWTFDPHANRFAHLEAGVHT